MKQANSYDQAVAKSRSEAVQPPSEIDDAAAPGMIAVLDSKEFAAFINENKDWEVAPQSFTLKPNTVVKGMLEGYGAPAQLVDAHTNEPKEVNTWIIASKDGRVRISILSSYDLDKKLPGFIGCEVRIGRRPDENIGGGKRFTPYLVAGTKLPGGKLRDWSGRAAPDHQLTAGES